jgi:hypothetical protein
MENVELSELSVILKINYEIFESSSRDRHRRFGPRLGRGSSYVQRQSHGWLDWR